MCKFHKYCRFQSLAAALFVFAGTAKSMALEPEPVAPPVNPDSLANPTVPPAQSEAVPADGSPNTGLSSVGNPSNPGGKPPVEAGTVVADKSLMNKGNTPSASAPAKPSGSVEITGTDVVNLHVNDEELANVLEMLSIQSERNIVASKNVAARITANLYGVTFYQALDAILHVNGYGYIEKDSFIYVYTLEELRAIEAAQRLTVWKTLPLNYLTAVDAAEFVKPLLSDKGQIKTNGKTLAYAVGSSGPTGKDDYAGNAQIVVFDYEENVAEIEKLVKQMDSRPAQILIEATILQTALTEANAFGVDFSLIGDMDFLDFAKPGPLKVVDGLIAGVGERIDGGKVSLPGDGNGKGVQSTAGNTAGAGTFKIGVTTKDFAVFIKMLDEVSDTTILSNPKVFTLNRMPARVLVGRKVGYLNTTSSTTTTTQTVQFLDTGTQLNVRPFVTNDGLIRMELKPQVSEAVIRDTKDSTGASVTIPDEITNELTTNVMVRDGQTIVLGGLFRESTTSTRRQVPWLGDIPVIGNAFKGKEDTTQRNEIIFLITPSIVNDALMADVGTKGKEWTEKVRTGSREGVLWWSRDRMSSKLNVEAERLAAEGDTEKAMWKVNQSMRMNPNQPEAVLLREKISGKSSATPARSVLESIMSKEALKRTGAVNELPTPAPFTPSTQSVSTTETNTNTTTETTTNPAVTAALEDALVNTDQTVATATESTSTETTTSTTTTTETATDTTNTTDTSNTTDTTNNNTDTNTNESTTDTTNTETTTPGTTSWNQTTDGSTQTAIAYPGQGVILQDWHFDAATATAQDWAALWDFSLTTAWNWFPQFNSVPGTTDTTQQVGTVPSEPIESGSR